MKPIPPAILARLRPVCVALLETYEEQTWVGTRWRIRKRTFAHVLMVDARWPPAYAKAAGSDGLICVMTFRSPLPQLDAYAFTWEPFFRPVWFPNIVGLRLDGGTDWGEVAGLMRASYCLLVPRKLAEQAGPPIWRQRRRTAA